MGLAISSVLVTE